MSTVVWDGSKIVLPINEPADGKKKSQIQEYLDFYGCPGVQHIAMRTDDIVAAVAALRERGVRFLAVPDRYYDDAKERMAGIDLPWDELQRLGILVDRDHDGHLLQVFTETVTRPPDGVLRDHPARGRQGIRRGQLQGAVRGHRTRTGPPRQPLTRSTCRNCADAQAVPVRRADLMSPPTSRAWRDKARKIERPRLLDALHARPLRRSVGPARRADGAAEATDR